MFIERLTETDLTELLQFIMVNAYGYKNCVSSDEVTGLSYEVAKDYNLSQDDKMLIYSKLSKKNASKIGFELCVASRKLFYNKSVTGFNVFICKDAHLVYEVNDFNLVHANKINTPIIQTSAKTLNKAYLMFMYKKFGKEFKKAYMDYRVKYIGEIAKETQAIADEMKK